VAILSLSPSSLVRTRYSAPRIRREWLYFLLIGTGGIDGSLPLINDPCINKPVSTKVVLPEEISFFQYFTDFFSVSRRQAPPSWPRIVHCKFFIDFLRLWGLFEIFMHIFPDKQRRGRVASGNLVTLMLFNLETVKSVVFLAD
jgi:hypothetical protein